MTKNPLLLSTAVEAVIKAGEIQMSFIESGFEVSHKGRSISSPKPTSRSRRCSAS